MPEEEHDYTHQGRTWLYVVAAIYHTDDSAGAPQCFDSRRSSRLTQCAPV